MLSSFWLSSFPTIPFPSLYPRNTLTLMPYLHVLSSLFFFFSSSSVSSSSRT